MLYKNDVSARIQIDFDAVPARANFRTILDPSPNTCVLELEGQTFDLCSNDPKRVLEEMRRHLWIAHESDMRDEAADGYAHDYADAAE